MVETPSSRWFYIRSMLENKSGMECVVTQLTQGIGVIRGHEAAEMRTGTAGFCRRPSSMADPLNCW
jgi:hypothetical protein